MSGADAPARSFPWRACDRCEQPDQCKADSRTCADRAQFPTPCAAVEGAEKLPCPFCGKAPWIETEKASFAVMCVNAHCGESMSRWFATEAEAIAAWNVRAPITTPPARTYAEGVSASEMVARWQQEYLATPGAHWGDTIAWNNAFVIAAKLDEAAATSRSQHEGAGR